MILELLLRQIYVPPVVQGPPADQALRSPRADADGPAPSTAAGPAASAPANPSISPIGPAGAPASPLQPPPPVYLRRSGPLCSDFRPRAGAGWSAVATVEFPGPRGPVRVQAGDVVASGDYLDGYDLGSVLGRDCPRTPPP